MVRDLETRLQKSKDNVEQIQKIMALWSKTPLFERLESKNSSLLYLTDREEKIRKRYDDIRQHGAKIHELLKVSFFP
jgi:dynein heavy chain, axonemal